MSAGYGSRGQGVGRVQVESSLTATKRGKGFPIPGKLVSVWKAKKSLDDRDQFTNPYLSNPDTSRYFPSHTHTTRAPLWPSGPGPS